MRELFFRPQSGINREATVIRDEHGSSEYLLVGKWGLRGDALSLYHINGDLLAEIKQLSLGMFPKFALFIDRKQIGTMGHSFGLVQEMIYIRGLNWIVVGNIMTNKFRIYHGTDLIMTINPVELSDGLTLQLSINREDYEPICICIAAILNRWSRRHERQPLAIPSWSSKRWLKPTSARTIRIVLSKKILTKKVV